jgi:hypothetical protein
MPLERRAEERRGGAREATGVHAERVLKSEGVTTAVATLMEREGQKRWSRGESQAANPRRGLRETSDRERCTNI